MKNKLSICAGIAMCIFSVSLASAKSDRNPPSEEAVITPPRLRITRTGGTKDPSSGEVKYRTVNQTSSDNLVTLECRGPGSEICGLVTLFGTAPGTNEYDLVRGMEVADQLFYEYISCSSNFEKEIVLTVNDEFSYHAYRAVLTEKELGDIEILVYVTKF